MSIPKPSETKQPILNYLAQATEPVTLAVLIEEVGRHFALTKEEMEERVPSGGMGRLATAVTAATKEMKAARLVQSPRFGRLEITETGREGINRPVANETAQEPTPQPASKREEHSSPIQSSNEQDASKPRILRPVTAKEVESPPIQSGNEREASKPRILRPAPAKEAQSPPIQPGNEQEAPKPRILRPAPTKETQSPPRQSGNEREAPKPRILRPAPAKEAQSPPVQSGNEREAPKPRILRPAPAEETQSLPTQPGNEQESPKPKTQPAPTKDDHSSPTRPASKKVAAEPKGQPGRKKKVDVLPTQPSRNKQVPVPQPQPVSASDNSRFVELASRIVASYVSKTTVDFRQVPEFIKSTHAALAGLRQPASGASTLASQKPAVPIEESVRDDYIVCLEDGRKFKSLKRYLGNTYNMSPEEYRAKWELPPDYPMNAPNSTKSRSDLAKKTWRGRIAGTGRQKAN